MEGHTINKKGKTEKNKRVKSGACIFPFKYKGQLYNDCLDKPFGRICATEINPKNRVLTKYGVAAFGFPCPFLPLSINIRFAWLVVLYWIMTIF